MSSRQAVKVIETEPQLIEIPFEKVCRYLGLGKTAPEAQLQEQILKSIDNFKKEVSYEACFREVLCRETSSGTDLELFFASGERLKKALSGCDKAIIFAATTGLAAEMSRRRAAVNSPLQALLLDAVGTTAIESFCDKLCTQWKEEYEGYFLRPRFSPGYGDLPIEIQAKLLDSLEATNHAGISLTESYLMIPQKSVTAIVGLGEDGCRQKEPDCSLCDKTDCQFRLQ